MKTATRWRYKNQRTVKKKYIPGGVQQTPGGPVWTDDKVVETSFWTLPLFPLDLQAGAACAGKIEAVERFFINDIEPDRHSPKSSDERDALWVDYCRDCPVLAQCFDWAMQHEEYGIWAGTTENDRYRARLEPAFMQQLEQEIKGS